MSFPNVTAISLALDPSFNEDQDILILPLDLLKYDTHAKLAQDVIKHFGKVTGNKNSRLVIMADQYSALIL